MWFSFKEDNRKKSFFGSACIGKMVETKTFTKLVDFSHKINNDFFIFWRKYRCFLGLQTVYFEV